MVKMIAKLLVGLDAKHSFIGSFPVTFDREFIDLDTPREKGFNSFTVGKIKAAHSLSVVCVVVCGGVSVCMLVHKSSQGMCCS